MCSLWAWQSEWVHTPSSHLTACGHASVTAFTWGCTIWFEPPMTQMSSCHICLNSDSVFSNPAQLNLNQLAPLKNPPCIRSIICIMYVHGGLISRLCEHASTSALLRIGSRSRFCCVWSWAGWVSRPSQMNRGWEEAWRGCRGWEARALPKKLLLWDLCTFAFLTKHSAWLKRQSIQGGRHTHSQRSAQSCPLCFSSYILSFRLQFLHFRHALLFSPSVLAATLNHFQYIFFYIMWLKILQIKQLWETTQCV